MGYCGRVVRLVQQALEPRARDAELTGGFALVAAAALDGGSDCRANRRVERLEAKADRAAGAHRGGLGSVMKSAASSVVASDRISARSMTLRSSRTLPGHS